GSRSLGSTSFPATGPRGAATSRPGRSLPSSAEKCGLPSDLFAEASDEKGCATTLSQSQAALATTPGRETHDRLDRTHNRLGARRVRRRLELEWRDRTPAGGRPPGRGASKPAARNRAR